MGESESFGVCRSFVFLFLVKNPITLLNNPTLSNIPESAVAFFVNQIPSGRKNAQPNHIPISGGIVPSFASFSPTILSTQKSKKKNTIEAKAVHK